MANKRTKRKMKNERQNFALSNDYELDNIITKQVIAYQRSRVLITLLRITVSLVFYLDHTASYPEMNR